MIQLKVVCVLSFIVLLVSLSNVACAETRNRVGNQLDLTPVQTTVSRPIPTLHADIFYPPTQLPGSGQGNKGKENHRLMYPAALVLLATSILAFGLKLRS